MARQRPKSLVVFSSGDPDYRFMSSNLGKLGFLFNFVLLCLFSLVIDVVVWIFISICYSILLICSSGTRVFGFCHVNAKIGFGWICVFFLFFRYIGDSKLQTSMSLANQATAWGRFLVGFEFVRI